MPHSFENSERDLLRQVTNGSENAFEVLFHSYRDKLYSFVLTISESKPVSEDVVQDVFLRIWQHRDELAAINSFSPYLFRMAHNQVVNLLQRKAKESLILAELSRQEKSAKDAYGDLDYKDVQDTFQKAVDMLPQRQKQVFVLSRLQGLKQEEIARQLDISITTVKSHMKSALRAVREHCKGSYPGMPVPVLLMIAGFLLS